MAFIFITPSFPTGLVHEDCITKMRLMTLVDLSSNDAGEVPYSTIKEALQVILIYLTYCAYTFLFLVNSSSEGFCCNTDHR